MLRNGIKSLEKSALEIHAISTLVYGSEFWTDEEKTKGNKFVVLPKKYQKNIPGAERVINNEVLNENVKKILIAKIRKSLMKFLGHIMKRSFRTLKPHGAY